MKKIGFFAIAAILMSSGTAMAASHTNNKEFGVWFGVNTAGGSSGWQTAFNVINTGTANAAVTVTFYSDVGGDWTTYGTAIGSTTKTLAPNSLWNFGTTTIGNISTSVLTNNVAGARGIAIISSDTGMAHGYITQWNSTSNAGFNYRIIDNTLAGH